MDEVRSPEPRDRPAPAPAAPPALPPPRRKLVLPVLAVLAVAAAGLWLWPESKNALFGPAPAAGFVTVSGNIEAHESLLSFTQVQAPIVALPFDEGAAVAAGTVLARVDDRLYRQQVQIDASNLQVQAAQVTQSENNLAAAQSNVTSTRYDLTQKQSDAARDEQLVRTNAVSVQDRDRAQTAARQSAAALAHDEAMVLVAQSAVDLAQANVAALRERLLLDQITLGYTVLRAPFAGVIAIRQAELGELAGPGVAIFSLDDLDHVWLRAYVNEPDLGKVRLGQAVDVTTDTYPGHIYHGRISFISPQAEFTPKTVQTFAERVTLVYRVRIDIDNPHHELLPGMPADAKIRLLAAKP
ncbi:HlyD family secretion protein [Acidocella sp.]|jgi:HlyD family secretion protein|uniref:HlyD family secretion protein n=1 Tax=Acidocella sp. TaxID=50710 RepID=UPI002F3F6CBA